MTEVQQGAANAELVERVLQDTQSDELAELYRDDARWEEVRARLEPHIGEDCVFAWIALGQRTERLGIDGLRAGWLDWMAPWAEYHSETGDVRAVGDETVLAFARQLGVPASGGAPVEMLPAAVVRVHDGKIRAVDFYAQRDDAVAAAEGRG
jgi:hypothetical protein